MGNARARHTDALTSYVSASGGVLVRIRSAKPSGSWLCIQQMERAWPYQMFEARSPGRKRGSSASVRGFW